MNDLNLSTSKRMLNEAKEFLPKGVGSGARAPFQIVASKGEGSRIFDVDGNSYIDCMMGMGPLILGHRNPRLIAAVTEQINERGSMYAMAHELEVEVSKKIISAVPSIEKVCFSNSGSEAVMDALRIARAYTGKEKIVRFEGHYHGWTDMIYISSFPALDAAGPREAPNRVPDSAGTPELYGELLIPLPWNDVEILGDTVTRQRDEIAAIIMEPILGNSGCIPPKPGYLEFVRDLATENDIVLIFDEVITGFRAGFGGAQARLGVTPDLTTLAKALGGGFPIAATGGKKEIMDVIVDGGTAQAGTYCTNPTVMSAANAVLDQLAEPGTYDHLFAIGEKLGMGLEEIISRAGHPAIYQGAGALFSIFFSEEPLTDYRQSTALIQAEPYEAFQSAMLNRGVWFHPWPIELWFMSTAHSQEDIDYILNVAEDAIGEVK
jgi:glutamate-1-semialdehyde 2,1-aminomutase